MTMSDKCSICGEWLFKSEISGKRHKCPPAWWCWISDPAYDYDRDEDGKTIYSLHPDDAAKELIERWDAQDCDYTCIGGDELQVSVAPLRDPGSIQVFTVRGEMVPEYWAEQAR